MPEERQHTYLEVFLRNPKKPVESRHVAMLRTACKGARSARRHAELGRGYIITLHTIHEPDYEFRRDNVWRPVLEQVLELTQTTKFAVTHHYANAPDRHFDPVGTKPKRRKQRRRR